MSVRHIDQVFQDKAELLNNMHKLGAIDDGRMSHALQQLKAEREQMMALQAAKEMESHTADAFKYGAASGQGRRRAPPTPWDKLSTRMEWTTDVAPLPLKVTLTQDGGYVFCMAVINGEAVVLKDDEHMWPSDQTVTQLRMLANG